MNKTIRIVASLSLCASAFLFTSCASYSVSRVDSSQFRASMGLDPQDVKETSALMAESLLADNILKRKGAGGRSIIAISNFRNNTSLYDFDPNLIYNPIRVTLNKSGVAYAYVKNQEDSFVSGNRARVNTYNEEADFLGDSRISSGPSPQYSLTLQLIENATFVGNRSQKAYQIHMTLNQIGSGLAIWEDIQDINKLGRRAAIGF
jgi:PBP1b-binding outer membrane lipoprotein LpoB